MIYRSLITKTPYILSFLLLVGLFVPMILVEANDPGGIVDAAEGGIKNILYTLIVNLFGWLLWVAGELLNWTVEKFVIGFGETFTGGGAGVAVDALWVTVRDFFNIIFIFGLVYIGFKMILNSDDSRTRSTLVTLIMAALLVNFSLFITKFVVDFTNILAQEVACAGFPASAEGLGSCKDIEIANVFFEQMGIPGTLRVDAEVSNGNRAAWSFIFGSGIIYLIAAFVFFSGAIMLIIRFVALCVYMVLSPFMFIGWVLPGFQSMTNKYWSGFLGRAFYAPVYIILIYFAAFIIDAMFNGGSVSGDFANLDPKFSSQGITDFAGMLGPFILSSAFLIAAVQVAGRLSADGASTVMKVGNNLVRGGRRQLQNGALYAPRLAGQNAIAVGGAGVSGATRLARRTGLGRLATNNRAGQALLNARNSSKQVKLGAGSTMRERDVAKAAMSSRSEREVALRKAQGIKDTKKVHEYNDEDRTALAAAERAANDYSVKDIENMTVAERQQITPYLKAATTAKLLESDQLSSKEKGQIQSDYSAAIHDKIIENGEVITEEITNLSVKQLEILGDQFVRDYAGFLSESQMDDLKKSDVFTEAQKGAQKAARKSMFKAFGAGNTVIVNDPKNRGGKITLKGDSKRYLFRETKRNKDTGAVETGKSLRAVDLAARPLESYIDSTTGQIRTEARSYVTADTLKQIARNSQQGKPTLSDNERETLAQAVINTPGLNARVYSYLDKEKAEEDFFMSKTMRTQAKTLEERAKDPNKAIRDAVNGDTLGM